LCPPDTLRAHAGAFIAKLLARQLLGSFAIAMIARTALVKLKRFRMQSASATLTVELHL
jgi:hypothetical protein